MSKTDHAAIPYRLTTGGIVTRRLSSYKATLHATLFAVVLLSHNTLSAATEPPFEWDESFESPGTSLSIKVEMVMGTPPRGAAMFAVKSSGFEEGRSDLVLWIKNSGEFVRFDATLKDDGAIVPGGFDMMSLGGYLRGQPLEMALLSESANKRAQAKIIPFPIEAMGDRGCQATAELETGTGLMWIVRFSGFEPGEPISVTSASRKDTITQETDATESGEVSLPILYPKRSKGKASVEAVGSKGCTVKVEYAIGKSARKAK